MFIVDCIILVSMLILIGVLVFNIVLQFIKMMIYQSSTFDKYYYMNLLGIYTKDHIYDRFTIYDSDKIDLILDIRSKERECNE